VVLVTGLGGCTGSGSDSDGGDPPRLTDASLRDTGRCSAPETATVDASASRVRVTGCITGPNGCAIASFGSARLDDGTLVVVVTTRRDAPPDTACTEALVHRGYEATVTVEGGRPARVRVVHDTAGGRREVADVHVGS